MDRSERPGEGVDPETHPTVAAVLAAPPLSEAAPELIAGAENLGRTIRWVHVSDGFGIGRFLVGGELLLTTGAGWPSEPGELVRFIGELDAAGVACLVVELGGRFQQIPEAVAAECAARRLPLVVLHREVRFVSVTEAIHRRIIVAQTDALQAREHLRTMFAGLILHGAPADHIVLELSRLLAAPVVLENLSHEAIIAAGLPTAEAIDGWQQRSRLAHRDPEEGWLTVPIEARGVRWGALVALPGPSHPAGRRAVLEQGAIALALGRFADGGTDEWGRIGSQRLIDALLEGRFSARGELGARLQSAGFPIADRALHGFAISASDRGIAAALDQGMTRLGGRAVAGVVDATVVGLLSIPASASLEDDDLMSLVEQAARGRVRVPERLSIGVGTRASDLDGLLRSVQQARELLGPRGVQRAEARPLSGLVATLRNDRRLQEHSERMLAPVIEYDLAHGGDLLAVLRALLAHPGNRTAAAAASHLSRSVFYQRLGLISELLGVDLEDGEQLAALHLAALARGR